jgi:hypothetical protein
MSPVSPGGSSVPSSSRILIVDPTAGRPTLPGRSYHSSAEMTVPIVSVPP